MDNDNSPVRQEDSDNRKINVWTPEDAARFLSSAIQEAQRPLTDALRQRSVSPGLFALVVALLVAAAAVCGWVLFDRLEKSDQVADGAREARDQALGQRYELQARHEALASRLTASQEIADRSRRELEAEIERLRTETAGLKGNEEELRRVRAENQKYRRRDEQLRNQIAGLELENQALARQLAAVKALSFSEDETPVEEFPDDIEIVDVDLPEPAAEAEAQPPAPPAAVVAAPPASPAAPVRVDAPPAPPEEPPVSTDAGEGDGEAVDAPPPAAPTEDGEASTGENEAPPPEDPGADEL